MASIREQILSRIVSDLGATNVPVYRHRNLPIDRKDSKALVVSIQGDSPTARNTVSERVLTVSVEAYAKGATAWADADALICAAHRLIMQDPGFGGLASETTETDTEWESDEADLLYVALPAGYLIRYRTSVDDLEIRA